MHRNYKLTLSYVGTHYFGWQKTIDGPSIEKSLEDALRLLLKHEITLQAASRTDRGVHAEGQVVNFFSSYTPPSTATFLRSLNQLLPRDIKVTSLEIMPLSFHPTLDALGKEYNYSITNAHTFDPFSRDHAWHVPQPLCLTLMREAAPLLLGTHDFSAFTNTCFPKPSNPFCTLSQIEILSLPAHQILIRILGDHFLYKMVRNLVGALVYVGLKKISVAAIPHILASKDRKLAEMTAPAAGLRLKHVRY